MRAILIWLMWETLQAQPAPPPRFEVAAIKPTPPNLTHGPSGGTEGKGRYHMHNRTLKDYIWRAYLVTPDQVLDGPPWVDSDRFDINAKSESPTDDDKVFMGMLRTLLEERFHLKLHREARMGEAVFLEAGKGGSKLQAANEGRTAYNNMHGNLTATRITMSQFAEIISHDLKLPVEDRTGLAGAFTFNLRWNADAPTIDNPEDTRSFLTSEFSKAATQQLGLTLKVRRMPVEVLVIDGADKPTDN
jgi:uncharacterized protein (TIGR03435 family)